MREYSDENLDFWMDVEQYKTHKKGKKSAFDIFREYVDQDAPREVSSFRIKKMYLRICYSLTLSLIYISLARVYFLQITETE